MRDLPATYSQYVTAHQELMDTVLPVFRQSAADQKFGVRIVVLPHGHQAHVDESLPYGTITEDVD